MGVYIMWAYKGEEFTENMIDDNVGFVYIITNETNKIGRAHV